MTIVLNGDTGITSPGGDTQAADTTINGVRVGRGAGAVATNTAVGASALAANTSGVANTAIGADVMVANTTGGYNSAYGRNALGTNTTGGFNASIGYNSLLSNTTGSYNTAVGAIALQANTTGGNNTAVGYNSSTAITTGIDNVSVGYNSLSTNAVGSSNTAIGRRALFSSTVGENTAVGFWSLTSDTTGTANTALGMYALQANTTGSNSTAVGYQAGYSNTVESSTYVGYRAGANTTGTLNAFFGFDCGIDVTSGTRNTIIGSYNGNQGGLDIRTASNYIVLSDGDGNPRMWIAGTGGYFVPNIRSSATANNDLRFNTGNGEMYYQTSSQRYKTNIVDLEFDTSNLYNLRPVSYDDKATGERCFGLIAEETFAQIPDVVVQRDIDGEILPDSIPYSMLSVVIINEMKKLKTLVDTQAAIITQLQVDVAALKGQA